MLVSSDSSVTHDHGRTPMRVTAERAIGAGSGLVTSREWPAVARTHRHSSLRVMSI